MVVGVANARVVARMTDLPALPDDELRSSLPYQVQDLIPIPVDEAELDFQVVERHIGEGADERVRVLLVAAHRDMLRAMLDALEGAGLSASRIDLIPFALIRALHDPSSWLADEETPGHEVIVGSGAGVTNVVVHRNGVPHFVRTLPTGGAAVTEALAGDLEIERDEAEALKRGLAGPVGDRIQVDGVAMAALSPLLNDVAGSLDFHLAQADDGELRRVILSGGGGRLRPMRAVLQDQLGVPVVEGNPYARLDVSKANLDPIVVAASADLFTVAIGLALAGEDSSGRRAMSLLPSSISEDRAERRQTVLAGAGVGVFAALLIGLTYVRGTHVDSARAEAARAEERTSTLTAQVHGLHDVEQLQAGIANGTQTIATALQGDVNWPALFRDVSAVAPEDVWLLSFNGSRATDGSSGTLQITSMGADQTSAARWLLRLGEIPSIQNPWLSSSTKSASGTGGSLTQFSSTATLTPAAGSDRVHTYTEDTK